MGSCTDGALFWGKIEAQPFRVGVTDFKISVFSENRWLSSRGHVGEWTASLSKEASGAACLDSRQD